MELENIEKLNKQLEGIIMGENEIEKLLEKAKDEKLREIIEQTLNTTKEYKRMVTEEIKELHGDIVEDEGMWGKIIEFFSNFSNMKIDTDIEVAEAAIKGTEMGFKGTIDILVECKNLDEDIKESVKRVSDRYIMHIKDYEEYLESI